MMSPIFRFERAADVRKQDKKGDLKTIWFMKTLPFNLNVEFISVHMRGEDCKVRLMSMVETYAVIHHHNKA